MTEVNGTLKELSVVLGPVCMKRSVRCPKMSQAGWCLWDCIHPVILRRPNSGSGAVAAMTVSNPPVLWVPSRGKSLEVLLFVCLFFSFSS